MTLTASDLRKNIYKFLDKTLETSKPLQIKRKGRMLKIVPVIEKNKFLRLNKHDCIVGDPDALVHVDWQNEWKHDLP